jgi:hypothetical protein
MTHRQKRQYERGCGDCVRGVEHKEGRGKYYDIGYSYAYYMEQSSDWGWSGQ